MVVAGSILLIDDDVDLIREVAMALMQEGYLTEHVVPGTEAFRKLLVDAPDLVILGLDCQESDWSYCRQVLTFLDNPLLLLLTTDSKLDRTRGLEIGADDCMIKPVITEEVVARSRALLRRHAGPFTRVGYNLFIDEHFVIDLACREVRIDGRRVILTPTELRILCCLAKHAGEALSSDRLATQVWGAGGKGNPETIKVYVHRLRNKLEVDPRNPTRIVTRRGAGYLFSVSCRA
jgi:two-component system response regulator VicR